MQGVLDRNWNSERPLVFAHRVLTRTLSAHKTRDIRSRINQGLDLWERGIHAGLVVGALSEGRDRFGYVEQINK